MYRWLGVLVVLVVLTDYLVYRRRRKGHGVQV